MKDRFVVLDNYLSEVSQHATAAGAIKSAQENAGSYNADGYGGDEGTYYVAQILGTATNKSPPKLAPYTALPALTKATPKKAAAKKASKRK